MITGTNCNVMSGFVFLELTIFPVEINCLSTLKKLLEKSHLETKEIFHLIIYLTPTTFEAGWATRLRYTVAMVAWNRGRDTKRCGQLDYVIAASAERLDLSKDMDKYVNL